ncbi:EAL domain-containing protein [Loigolactobacillus zhaoyuanensis]|uniref:EAL domain-containing protein n=1 Tax=Loigolactobacillus zhaoyuanensis TaxID=2486017 RepID=A0ABW8UDC7_9LACO|nr:EAL domain-containing protein [Loigolactobacillus zhaoyuanensis]
MYKYFVQPILNKHNQTLISYELLLKEKTAVGWRAPASFAAISPTIIATLLLETTSQLELKIGSVAVNLNRTQMINPKVVSALLAAQDQLRPVRLKIEVTEEVTAADITNKQLIPVLRQFSDHGMEISLDDVGSGRNLLAQITQLIPYAHEIKFALQNFDSTIHDPLMQAQVIFWRNFADRYKLRFILEGIENADDDELVDHMNIDLRQGYYYGKPHPVAC